MRFIFLSLSVFLLSSPLFALIEIGQEVPELCWKNEFDKNICLSESSGTIRVLIHSTGWCPDCTESFRILIPKVKAYFGLPVTFISLSAEGFIKKTLPDAAFLKAWKEKYQIPFLVLASPKNAGKIFYDPPHYVPNFVIIDKDGKLAFKNIESSVDVMFAEINRLLD